MKNLLSEWIKVAEDDLDTASFCYNGKRFNYFWIVQIGRGSSVVEQRTENPRVVSSILTLGTVKYNNY